MMLNQPERSIPVDEPDYAKPNLVTNEPVGLAPGGAAAYGKYDLATVLQAQQPSVTLFLKPIAAPSAMGLAGFASSTWLLSTYLCAWYGGTTTPGFYFPFVMIFGGLGQFIAGLFGFPARDNLATVIHVAWGSFFLAYGIEVIFQITGFVPITDRYAVNQELAMWLVCLAAITWICFIASFSRDLGIVITLFFLAAGTTVAFAGYFAGSRGCIKAAGYLLMISSVFALYRVFHFLLEESFQRLPQWFPVFKTPWEKARPVVKIPLDEPGVKKGQ